ncbi:hypothetical protein G9A89_010188 [Geosiphon pyriformis]|nr:hypothetical protein G9A89_010188 [Geosiphon pyriformis]
MAYVPIIKLDKFTGKEDDTQVWLNDVAKAITANNWDDDRAMQAILYFLQDIANAWYQSLTTKPQNFNEFKTEFLRYFSNNNSINKLTNTFTTIKQEKTEAVTTYLRQFYRNLCQIQAIQADYFTAPQILNQFIYFEAAKLEANYAQTVNLVINGLSELNSKLKQFNCFQNQSHPTSLTNQQWQQETRICHYCGRQEHLQFECQKRISDQRSVNHSISTRLLTYDAADISNTNDAAIILTFSLSASNSNLSTAVLTQLSAAVSGKLSIPTTSNTATELTSKQNSKTKINTAKLEIIDGSPLTDPQSRPWNSGTGYAQNPNSQNYLSFLVTPKNAPPNNPETNQKQSLTNNIPSATITNNESLAVIFPFELEEIIPVPLFSGATLNTKPITTMYTDAKINSHFIKLILNIDHAASARIITADGTTKTPIGEIDDFPIEVNGIIVSIKVLVIEATQYQALVSND